MPARIFSVFMSSGRHGYPNSFINPLNSAGIIEMSSVFSLNDSDIAMLLKYIQRFRLFSKAFPISFYFQLASLVQKKFKNSLFLF